jgi:hypothetical protein
MARDRSAFRLNRLISVSILRWIDIRILMAYTSETPISEVAMQPRREFQKLVEVVG